MTYDERKKALIGTFAALVLSVQQNIQIMTYSLQSSMIFVHAIENFCDSVKRASSLWKKMLFKKPQTRTNKLQLTNNFREALFSY